MIKFNDSDWKFLRVALGAWKQIDRKGPSDCRTRIHFAGSFKDPQNYFSVDQFITPNPSDTDEDLTICMTEEFKMLKQAIDRFLGSYADHSMGLRWIGKSQKNEFAVPLKEAFKVEVYYLEPKKYYLEISSIKRKCLLVTAQVGSIEQILLTLFETLRTIRSSPSLLKPLRVWNSPPSTKIQSNPCSIYFLR